MVDNKEKYKFESKESQRVKMIYPCSHWDQSKAVSVHRNEDYNDNA